MQPRYVVERYFKPTCQLGNFNIWVISHVEPFQGFGDCLLDVQSDRANLRRQVIAFFQLSYDFNFGGFQPYLFSACLM